MPDFAPRGLKLPKAAEMHRLNSSGIHREPEFYTARGLGTPHRDPNNAAKQKAQLLGETEL